MRVLVALALLLCACGEDETSPEEELGPPGYYPVAGCEHLPHAPCDTLLTECQVIKLELTACLRGSEPGELPAIRRITEAEYADEFRAWLEAQPQRGPEFVEPALRLLGLVPEGAYSIDEIVDRRSATVAAFYTVSTKEITVIDRGEPADGSTTNATLVHELVHALQDRDLDLARYTEQYDETDQSYAADALIEGEATLHHTRYFASAIGLDPQKIDWPARLQNSIALTDAALFEEEYPYLSSFAAFAYPYGARYVYFAWVRDGLDGVLALDAAPPSTTQEVMASVDGIVAAPDVVAFDAPVAPPSWSLFIDTPMGAWIARIALASALPLDTAHDLALSWRGDRFYIFTDYTNVTVVWKLAFADATSAEAAYAALNTIVRAERQETTVVVAASDSTAPLDWAFSAAN